MQEVAAASEEVLASMDMLTDNVHHIAEVSTESTTEMTRLSQELKESSDFSLGVSRESEKLQHVILELEGAY